MNIKNLKNKRVLVTTNEYDDTMPSYLVPVLPYSIIYIKPDSQFDGYNPFASNTLIDELDLESSPTVPSALPSLWSVMRHLKSDLPQNASSLGSDWGEILHQKLPQYDLYEVGITEHSCYAFSVHLITDWTWAEDFNQVDGLIIVPKGKYAKNEIKHQVNQIENYYNGWIDAVYEYTPTKDGHYENNYLVGFICMCDLNDYQIENTNEQRQKQIIDKFLRNLIIYGDPEDVPYLDPENINCDDWKVVHAKTKVITDFE